MTIKIEAEFEGEKDLFHFICDNERLYHLKIDDDMLFKLFKKYNNKTNYYMFLSNDIISCELLSRCCLILDDRRLKDMLDRYLMESFEDNEDLLERIVKLDHRHYKEIKNPSQKITDLYKALTL